MVGTEARVGSLNEHCFPIAEAGKSREYIITILYS